MVVSFFTLRFGWVGSGLVVPGYVVPLLIVKPWVAAVILIESCITYFIVWTLSEYLSRWGKWSSLFGRDRFFALLLFSIIVKVLFDGWILPAAGEFLNETFHLTFDYRNNLHSFGLIIVALIANQFWKPGFLQRCDPPGCHRRDQLCHRPFRPHGIHQFHHRQPRLSLRGYRSVHPREPEGVYYPAHDGLHRVPHEPPVRVGVQRHPRALPRDTPVV
ncbi:MAG: poly-gamma-glutamate biosynthesis protein PgsC/CapC [Desulfobacterales bacterium]|nr:poly-gamma-glutamate biosynthesis protein PgsC/CapC [Desulfobacterales bacterium]